MSMLNDSALWLVNKESQNLLYYKSSDYTMKNKPANLVFTSPFD